MIPLHSPCIDKNDIESVKKNLDSGWVSTASKSITTFEDKLKKFVGSKFALALNSGTSSIHLSLIALGVEKDDEIIVPSVTFIASINPISYIGASPVFMDCDNHYNLDIVKTLEFIQNNTYFKNGYTYNKKTKKKIKAIIVVHVFGNVCNFLKLKSIAKKKNIKIIEDAAESLGSFFKSNNYKRHSGTIGDIGCFSFNGNKIITTGSGGAIVTNSKILFEKIFHLSKQAKKDTLFFIHDQVGYNYRMNGIAASLGVSQISKLKSYLKKKKKIHNTYSKLFRNSNFEILSNPNNSFSNNWLNILIINDDKIIKRFKHFLIYLNNKGIQSRPLWELNHLQTPYKIKQKYKITNSELLYYKCLCLPSSVDITDKQINYIYKTIISYKVKI